MSEDVFKIIIVLTYAYLVGAIPLAYIVGRVVKGIDIRKYGSGNVGVSNVWVHVGKRIVIPLSLFDVLVKGGSPLWIARYAFGLGMEVQVGAGLLAVIGNNWSPYLRFGGGRGIAIILGVLLAMYPPLFPMELTAFIIVGVGGWVLFRSAALWVGISMLLLPVWAILLGRPVELVFLMVGLVFVVATKRLGANVGIVHSEIPLRARLMNRLLLDRDVSSREAWVNRRPP